MGVIAKEGREQEKDLIDDYSAIIHYILNLSIDKFQELLLSKYRKGIFQKMKIKDNCSEQALRTTMKTKLKGESRQFKLKTVKSISKDVL